MSPSATSGHDEPGGIRFLPLSYDSADSQASATKLILALRPQWAPRADGSENHLEFVRFTDGITNTLLKAVYRRPGLSKAQIDHDAILLRAYGNGTDILIDREREAANHAQLMNHGLAPDFLARFENGMLYKFIEGSVSSPQDLRNPEIFTAVARRLAEWHATMPCFQDHTSRPISSPNKSHVRAVSNASRSGANGLGNGHPVAKPNGGTRAGACDSVPGKPSPNVWTTMRKWVDALPTDTETQRQRQERLQRETEEMVQKLSQRPGLGQHGLVFAHCDLLSGNIIIHRSGDQLSVSFIDYEYATPSPAAFDIANHFAEWAGFDCDYSGVPKRNQRNAFIREYIQTYLKMAPASREGGPASDALIAEETDKLMAEVDVFRGVPGFYWGIWALIQAEISEIDFDYASYAEERLNEYWAYKAEEDGSRAAAGRPMSLREQTWCCTE
jgi:ethanolamine kinase